VIDGSTIEINRQRIRFLDMDAPADHLGQRTVVCDWSVRDRDGRKLARCSLADHDAGLRLVEQGWAVPDRDCKCETYRAVAARAKNRGVGLWAGQFDVPWVWRTLH